MPRLRLYLSVVITACVTCSARAEESRLPGLPSAQEILKHFSPASNPGERRRASGDALLAPDSEVPLFEENYRANHWPEWLDVLVARGSTVATEDLASRILEERGEIKDSALAQTLGFLSREELHPLALVVAKKLKANDLPPTSGWIVLAARSGDPPLMERVLSSMDAHPEAAWQFQNRFDPDVAAPVLSDALLHGDVERRRSVLRLLRHGWKEGPPADLAVLAHDPDATIRTTFIATLEHSSSASARALLARLSADPNASVRQVASQVRSTTPQTLSNAELRKAVQDKDAPAEERLHLYYAAIMQDVDLSIATLTAIRAGCQHCHRRLWHRVLIT